MKRIAAGLLLTCGLLAALACGRYGPPVRSTGAVAPATAPAPAPSVEERDDPVDDPDQAPEAP